MLFLELIKDCDTKFCFILFSETLEDVFLDVGFEVENFEVYFFYNSLEGGIGKFVFPI